MSDRPLREARIDLTAIAHNVQTLRAAIATEHTMAVVKANGYGHGAVPVARAAIAAGADWLGVADIEEALRLRAAGIRSPILAWLHHPEANFADAIDAGVDIGVSYAEQLERVAAASAANTGMRARVQIKVDTGLGRNGADIAEWQALFSAAAKHERQGSVHVSGLFSHLANAGPDDNLAQVTLMEQAIELAESVGLTPELRHLAATAGAISAPDSRFTLVRLGIGIYGLSPFDDLPAGQLGLRPAMELSGEIVAVDRDGSGTRVVVPLGYGDGVPRHGSAGAPVSINGASYPLGQPLGFDSFTVDLGDDIAWVGDRAVLFGDPSTGVPSVDDWAAGAETINYEVMTGLGAGIERSYST
jgi:alanine racemase